MYKSLTFFFLLLLTTGVFAQQYVLDRVVAVIGNEIILQSDIENQYLQMKFNGYPMSTTSKCQILESMLEQKLMVTQAKIDSIEVSEATVQVELDRRMNDFIMRAGGERELEAYFKEMYNGKSIAQVKEDFHDMIYEMLLSREMESEITKDIKITPSEVRSYFKKISADSLPTIPEQVELQQIQIFPKVPEANIFEIKEKLLSLRKRILNGESFVTLAVLYSEDGSASQGGEIGFMGKAELDQEYAKAAFSLKENAVSNIVQSEFGYHIIQLIERKGDRVNTRHILMRPKVPIDAKSQAIHRLDSIARLLRVDSMKFEQAAFLYSEPLNTVVNAGLKFNPQSGTSLLFAEDLTPEEARVVKPMQVGEISEAFETTDEKAKTVIRILYLKNRLAPHKANLDQDYTTLQNMALQEKKETVIKNWISEKQTSTYMKVDPSFKSCPFNSKGWFR
jgi:peptidyl-prolyl cis-trans isomerase SurA